MCASPSPPHFTFSQAHFFWQEVAKCQRGLILRNSSLHKRVGQAGAWAGRHRAERAAAQAQEQVAVLMHRVVVRGKSRVRAWVERQDYNHRADGDGGEAERRLLVCDDGCKWSENTRWLGPGCWVYRWVRWRYWQCWQVNNMRMRACGEACNREACSTHPPSPLRPFGPRSS
jgi:hypothetical protein